MTKYTFYDPFEIKRLSKLNPERIVFTVFARIQELISKIHFESFTIPFEPTPSQAAVQDFNFDENDTAVTPEQMSALVAAINVTNELDAPIAEIGAFRGVTTEIMASTTARRVYAVDPYAGYGGADSDLGAFENRTRDLPNVFHVRSTSGEASRHPELITVSFAFVDAVHDYVNARFDGTTWLRKLAPGGMIAFHDTDSRVFPGVMRAVWEILNDRANPLTLFIHVPGLVILQRH